MFKRHRGMGRGFQKEGTEKLKWYGTDRACWDHGKSREAAGKLMGGLIMKGSEAVLSLLSHHAFLLSCSLHRLSPL